MKEFEVTAKTVEEALDVVKSEQGYLENEYDYQIEDPGSKGFLKIGTRNAIIKISVKNEYFARRVKEFIEKILSFSLYIPESLSVSVESKDARIFIHLDGEHLGRMIGKHGKTISALQHLATIFVNRLTDTKMTVFIDVGDYKDRRKDLIRKIAKKKASVVVETGKSIQLDPMFAFERRIVHETVKAISGVQSFSRGLEPYRYVVIEPAKKARKRKPTPKEGASYDCQSDHTQAG